MTYQHTLAKIEATKLGYESHGIFSLAIDFAYGKGLGADHQSFGPMNMQGAHAYPLLVAVLQAAGVDAWEKLKGRTVYVVREEGYNGLVMGIAPLPTEPGTGFVLGHDSQPVEYSGPA